MVAISDAAARGVSARPRTIDVTLILPQQDHALCLRASIHLRPRRSEKQQRARAKCQKKGGRSDFHYAGLPFVA